MLLHCLGTEGQRIFHTLQLNAEDVENDNEYETALQVLDRHFQPKLNVVAERYKFRKRSQLPGESVDDYIRELRALASTCNFHDMTDEMIRDQFVERTNSTQIRERLLLEPTLTLADAITISCQFESAICESQIIGPVGINTKHGNITTTLLINHNLQLQVQHIHSYSATDVVINPTRQMIQTAKLRMLQALNVEKQGIMHAFAGLDRDISLHAIQFMEYSRIMRMMGHLPMEFQMS